jgi:uncharacterized protein involved in exopolysaccharide biosynthesis
VIYADVAALGEDEPGGSPANQTPLAMLKAKLLSEEDLGAVREAASLDPSSARTLGEDVMLRATAPPVFVAAYEHKDPETAHLVLKTLLARFGDRIDRSAAASAKEAEALDGRIADHERRLQIAEARLVEFKRSNADQLNGPEGQTASVGLLREEAAALASQIDETIEERDAVATRLATGAAEADAPSELAPARPLEEIELGRRTLETELAKLRERYADTHPYVVAVVEGLETLEAEAAAATAPPSTEAEKAPTAADLEALREEHQGLIAEVSALNSRLADKRLEIERLEALTNETSSVEAELSELEADKAALEAALRELKRSREELSDVAEGGDKTEAAFRLIREPNLPTEPIGPSRLLALGAVLLAGLGLAVAVAVGRNSYKGVFESAWQLKQRFDVGVLGTISDVMTPGERKRLSHSRLVFGLACLALAGAFGGLAVAESNNLLAPFGDRLRAAWLG